jgi:hypothetical protein
VSLARLEVLAGVRHGAPPTVAAPEQSSARRSRSVGPRPPKLLRVPDTVSTAPPKVESSVKAFVHRVLCVPNSGDQCSVTQSEDVIFAFQERLCELFEIEIEKDNGVQAQVFLTRLNGYLHAAETKAERKSGVPHSVSRKVRVCAALEESTQWASDVTEQFNVSVPDLEFVFASVSKDANGTRKTDSPPRLLAAALVRADSSEDSD